MSQKNETTVLVLALLVTAALLGGGFWWFRNSLGNVASSSKSSNDNAGEKTSTTVTSPVSSPTQSAPTNSSPAAASSTFAPPTTVPGGTKVRIEGSTSMVQINQAFKGDFENQFPGTIVETQAKGTEQGIQALQAGRVDIAAISRPLNSQEQTQGLVAIPVTQDAIAIVVGEKNPFRQGLTSTQVVGIFQGQITDWSKIGGGASGTIRVINRPPGSGTHQAFQDMVLKGGNFGNTPNITTLQQDVTTPLLRELGTNGIGYATFAQVAKQQTVRTVAVDGLTPQASTYPYQRTLYYAYKQPASPQVQAFLGYVGSSQGKQALSTANK